MGDGETLPLSSTDHSQQRRVLSVKYTHLDSSDESQSDSDLTWSPGDGVCPSTAQFNHCCQSKFHHWRNAASVPPEGSEYFHFYIRAFLGILQDVPSFFCRPPKGVEVTGRQGSFLIMRSSLRMKTTEDPNCDQPQKSIDYLQCLGCPTPVVYRVKAETQLQAAIPISANSLCSGYFTTIVLAWSYIISCRWVEILQQAGEESQIFHNQDAQMEDSFWEIVTHDCWVAQIKKKKGVFYSPWMLRREGTRKKRGNWTPVLSNSSFAFNTLLDFCMSEGLEGELLTGLALVLTLTSRNAPPPKFAPPIMVSATPVRSSLAQDDMIFHELFQSLDQCIFLSSTQDALDSLLCSAFFDPCIPCNLLGPASLGVRKALLTVDEIDNQQLLIAITSMKPHLSLFWAAVICSDQVTSFLNLALHSLPPICLVAAFWTNTTQSFLQMTYRSSGREESTIPRAAEFQTSYFCRPDISVPWSPAPPFGATSVKNLSLQVRAHLAHMHRPVSWMIYWILDSGERLPASMEHQLRLEHVHSSCCSCSIGHVNDPPCSERDIADEQSGVATSRLFNWHRSYDDGIWLDDGKGDIELVRRLQMHPWIIDPFDSLEDEPVEEPKCREFCVERILRWNGEVEKYRQSGGLITP